MKKNKNMKKLIVEKKGFSLIEVLISLTILTLGIATISMLMISNIKNSQEAKNQIVAMGLAQEGIELVRNLKDNNANFSTNIPDGADYSVDHNSTYVLFRNSPTDFNGDNKKVLYLTDKGFYVHKNIVGATPTKFFRKIIKLTSGSIVTVTSFVSWNPTAATTGFPPDSDIAKCTIANKCVSIISVMPDTN